MVVKRCKQISQIGVKTIQYCVSFDINLAVQSVFLSVQKGVTLTRRKKKASFPYQVILRHT